MAYQMAATIVTLNTPLSGTVCHQQLGHVTVNLPTKFELPVFTRYGNVKGVAKCQKWGG